MGRWAVFLDRDGVVTEAPVVNGMAVSPTSAADLHLVDGAREMLRRLHRAGALLVLVTNQPDVARGRLDPAELDAMHRRLAEELPLDRIMVCPHSGHECCECRKPLPGMLLEAAEDLDIDLGRSWMVGDRWVDIAAGRAAGVTTVLMDRPYAWSATSSGGPPADLSPDHRIADVGAVVPLILTAQPGLHSS